VNRRSLGRGRLIVAVGASVVLAGSVAPWWTVGGTVTDVLSGNAFEGAGIVVFVCAVLMLALIVLPYATREGSSRLDRAPSYVALAGVAIGAFALRAFEIQAFGGLALPDRAPGLWITGAGLAVAAWGVAEIVGERPVEH
jgi:hypothetical protein